MPEETEESDWLTMTTQQARDHVHDWIDDIDETDRLANLIQVICGFAKVATADDGKAIAMADEKTNWTTLLVDDARDLILRCVKLIDDPKIIARLLQDVCGCRKVAVLADGKTIAFQIE